MSVSVWSHPLYQRYNTHSIYDITSTVSMAQYAMYMTSHPRFMTLQHSTHDIKAIISHLTLIISESTSTVSLSSLPDYQSYNPPCMYDNTATICMTSYELHMASHPLFMISLHAMTLHPLYLCHHTQDTYNRLHCSWTITYSVLIVPQLLYVWHETHYMYDITGNLYDITLTRYDITILYSWRHIHSTHDSRPTLYDITCSILVTSQPLYVWQDTSYVYDIILSIYDISHGVWMTTTMVSDNTLTVSVLSHPLAWWYHTLCIYEITPTACRTP